MLTNLKPFTRYAYYIKAYTLAVEKVGVQSDVAYFVTLPGTPERVTGLEAVTKGSSEIVSKPGLPFQLTI